MVTVAWRQSTYTGRMHALCSGRCVVGFDHRLSFCYQGVLMMAWYLLLIYHSWGGVWGGVVWGMGEYCQLAHRCIKRMMPLHWFCMYDWLVCKSQCCLPSDIRPIPWLAFYSISISTFCIIISSPHFISSYLILSNHIFFCRPFSSLLFSALFLFPPPFLSPFQSLPNSQKGMNIMNMAISFYNNGMEGTNLLYITFMIRYNRFRRIFSGKTSW